MKHKKFLIENLQLNINKTAFWNRVFPGRYRLGDIIVDQRWNPKFKIFQWGIFVNDQMISVCTYLKDAKKVAHQIDKEVNKQQKLNKGD